MLLLVELLYTSRWSLLFVDVSGEAKCSLLSLGARPILNNISPCLYSQTYVAVTLLRGLVSENQMRDFRDARLASDLPGKIQCSR